MLSFNGYFNMLKSWLTSSIEYQLKVRINPFWINLEFKIELIIVQYLLVKYYVNKILKLYFIWLIESILAS